jgi:hypothetical protein
MSSTEIIGSDKSPTLQEKNEDFGKMAEALGGVKEASEATNSLLENCKKLTSLGKELKKSAIGRKSPASALSEQAAKLKTTLPEETTNKILGFVNGILLSELKKLTVGELDNTKKNILQLSELYGRIESQGITRPPSICFTGTDYWKAGYNHRIADAMEYAVENTIRRMEREERIASELHGLVKSNHELATYVLTVAPEVKDTLMDCAIMLAPISMYKGLGAEVTQLFAECAIGLWSLQNLLPRFRLNAKNAADVLNGQVQTYRATIRMMRDGHESETKKMSEYIRKHPDDVPANIGKDSLAVYLLWLGGKLQ